VDIQPIKTDADYVAAVDEVGALIDAAPGTPEGDRLDVLATLVHVYEDAHRPMIPPDPIDAIDFRMEQQGLTRASVAR
jgi:HTH-type transcriptional regulator/antitoxin HigA